MAVFLPCALFCFLIFGVEPMIAQLVNQLECDRLEATDCDTASVNGAAVLTMKYIEIVQYSCATLTLGTIGSVSDFTGRRLTMALSLVGQLVQTVMVLVVALVPGLPYRTALYLIYAGTVVTGLSGSYGTFLMGVYAYGADVTKENPTERGRTFARYTGAVAIGNTLGPLVNGLLLDRYGFPVPLAVLTAAAVAILLLLACIPESLSPADHPPGGMDVLRRHNTLAVFYRFLVTNNKNNTSCEAGEDEHGRPPARRGRVGRPSLLPLAAVFCLCFSDLVGQGTIFLYYARRVFHWRPAWLGYYESSVGFSKGVVLLIILPVAYRCLRRPPNDYVVCLVGMLFNLGYFLMLALLPFPEAAIAAVPLTGLSQMTYPHLRSLFSLAVARDAQGQLFSLISALETLATTLTPVVVNTVYNRTVETFPGMVWLVLAGYLVLAMAALNLAWRSATHGGKGPEGSPLALGGQDRRSSLSKASSSLDSLLEGGGRQGSSEEARRQLLGFEDPGDEHGHGTTGTDRL